MKELSYDTRFPRNRPPNIYYTTGFTKAQVMELCAGVRTVLSDDGTIKWPPVLGSWNSIVVTLAYLRRNRVQAEIGEQFGFPSRR